MPAKSSTIVTALTAAALVAVGVLGYQASASAPDHLTARGASHHAKRPAHPGRPAPKDKTPRPAAVPAASGTGKRVVYSLGAKRVWLVDAQGKALRTYKVAPSTVSPVAGAYQVTQRSVSLTGSDGLAIEHVVLFGSVNGVVVGFSAAVDGSTPKPNPGATKKTGGIRESRGDGKAMWDFALVGTKVVVVA
ncbi:L,D-transpeptidase [Streptomyces sp. NPDC101227]|uniref:L,D-transpeptidase n=1 Tax=Streptomyces sp. NPDC101227 TaxID=3366136 RepID=UPI0038072EEA